MQYDFNLNANSGQDINAVGRYVKYKSGLGAIRVRPNTGNYVDLLPGQSIRLPIEFGAINVADRSGNANAGILMIGNIEFQDDSIVGTVSIIDGGKNSTLSKNCFLATINAGSVAASFNAGLLINAPGSPKNLIVESVNVSSNVGQLISFHMLSLSPAGLVRGQNKCAAVGGGVPSQAYVENNFLASMAGYGAPMQRAIIQQTFAMTRKFAEPLILPPGMALAVVSNAVATDAYIDFEWREDPL